jgi:hypothetical protein
MFVTKNVKKAIFVWVGCWVTQTHSDVKRCTLKNYNKTILMFIKSDHNFMFT